MHNTLYKLLKKAYKSHIFFRTTNRKGRIVKNYRELAQSKCMSLQNSENSYDISIITFRYIEVVTIGKVTPVKPCSSSNKSPVAKNVPESPGRFPQQRKICWSEIVTLTLTGVTHAIRLDFWNDWATIF